MAVATNFKTMLYLLVSIAVLFIAIIPAKYVSGMFSTDSTAIFYLSLTGSFALLEFLAWCSVNGTWDMYASWEDRKQRLLSAQPATTGTLAVEPEPEESTHVEDATLQEVVMDIKPTPIAEETAEAAEAEEATAKLDYLQLHQAGCDAYYQRLSEKKKQELSAITEYVNYIMAPFIVPADMEAFTNEILSFATNADYKPKPWKGLKGTLTSFDVRHLIWNITARLGLGKGKPYSTDICAQFIMDMFPDICEGLDFSTLRNLRVTSQTDKIHLDEPKPDSFDFHIDK
jgi:hypothetical protein